MSVSPEKANQETSFAKFRWPIVIVLVALIFIGGIVAIVKSCAKIPSETVDAFGKQAASLLEKFDQKHITRTFEESLPRLTSSPGGRLELAALTVTEDLSESNNLATVWGQLDLGSTVTEIKVPATYRYYVRLHDAWKLEIATNICIVHAPRIHPFLPPAIDTSRMEKKSSEGWARFNAAEQMDQLEKDLTPTLVLYAGDVRHLSLVREECRKNVAQFVRDWLLREQQWRNDRFTAVKVIFPDEAASNLLMAPATLELKAH